MTLRHFLISARREVRILLGREPNFRRDVKLPFSNLGNSGANWPVLLDQLNPTSVVYSVGIGTDISFDLALIEHAGVSVHGFDPTPRSRQWLEAQRLSASFVFHPIGLSRCDGEETFYPPLYKGGFVSFSVQPGRTSDPGVTLNVNRLPTIMAQLGHRHLDVLKIDIEGSEYGVIDDLARTKVPVGQFLVEFHHWLYGYTVAHTEKAVTQLQQMGYQIFYISPSGHEYGFVHRDLLTGGQVRQPTVAVNEEMA